jgi:hypothetical protein
LIGAGAEINNAIDCAAQGNWYNRR